MLGRYLKETRSDEIPLGEKIYRDYARAEQQLAATDHFRRQ